MPFVPDWAPNVHPLIVHFPIALLFLGVLVDALGLIFKGQKFWRRAAMLLYVAGAVAALVTYLTGRAAGDSVFLPSEANSVLTEHSNLGLYTLWYFGIYTIARAGLFLLSLDLLKWVRVLLVVLAAGGLILLYETGEHGAEMVFRYGVGVQAVDRSPEVVLPAADSMAAAGPVLTAEGGWMWKPQRASAWVSSLNLLEGDSTTFTGSLLDGGDRGDVLGLTTDGEPLLLTFDHSLQTVQLDAALNTDQFEGTVMFVHNVIDAENYHFMAITDSEMRLGRSEAGDLYLLDQKPLSPDGWHSYRVVGDETHFRAYSDKTLVTHGHGEAPPSGSVGIRLNGSGTVLVDYIQVQPVR